MARLSGQDLRDKYALFNAGDLNAVVAQFSPTAEYRQTNTGNAAVGHDQIRAVMEGWGRCFGGRPQIEDIVIEPAHGLIREVPDAVQCFNVDFVGVGTYENTVPGMEDVAPAHGRPVRVPIGETVWVDKDGLFIRVDSAMQIAALQ